MSQENITLTLDSEKKAALSALATLMDRDISDVLNDAIATYLEMYQSLLAEIKNSLSQTETGDVVSEEQVRVIFAKLIRESIYREGKVELLETPAGIDAAKFTIAFLPKNGSVDLESRGINREQAANLRARLQSFAEDWNRPEMDVYDAL